MVGLPCKKKCKIQKPIAFIKKIKKKVSMSVPDSLYNNYFHASNDEVVCFIVKC